MFQPAVRGDGRPLRAPAELLLNELEQQVLDAIETETTSVDAIVGSTGLTVSQVLATISVLEMRHLIRRLSGATVIRI
jgi:DNA processing protein